MELTEEQRKAVLATEDVVLVVAGPGSGKTRVLTERAIHLVRDKKESPYNIWALTFTRKAAREMQTRIEGSCPGIAGKMQCGTFHSVALGFLRRFGETIGIIDPACMSIYNPYMEDRLKDLVAIETGIKVGGRWLAKKGDIDSALEEIYNGIDEPDSPSSAVTQFVNAFRDALRQNNASTYGMILVYFLEMLRKDKSILHHHNPRHILVDEAQDLNRTQWEIIRVLSEYGKKSKLFVVGDVDQSVYAWRGAVPEHLMEIAEVATVCTLTRNHRSSTDIVDTCERLIAHNKERIVRKMIPYHEPKIDNGQFISQIMDYHVPATLRNIAKMDWGNVGILSRTHNSLDKLSSLLKMEDIEHKKVGSESSIMKTREWNLYHSFLALAINWHDRLALFIIKDFIRMDQKKYFELLHGATANATSPISHWNNNMGNRPELVRFLSADGSMEEYLDLLDPIIETLRTSERTDRLEMASWFARIWMVKHGKQHHLGRYLDWLGTYDLHDEEALDSKGVILMTMHAAKGLEFNTVILPDFVDGHIPIRASLKEGRIEEERRLAYVAMSRARDRLYIATKPGEPNSRFLDEAIGCWMEDGEGNLTTENEPEKEKVI